MKPILFNTEMVRAILEGRKTQTRRVIKLPEGLAGRPVYDPLGLMYAGGINRPKYQVGDILWVRETWQDGSFLEDNHGNIVDYIYKADDDKGINSYSDWGIKWHPSIFMPREATRIFLRVTNVRVERVQEITERDAQAEGAEYFDEIDFSIGNTYVAVFKRLWDSLNEKHGYGWEQNPWVWIYEFEREQ